MRSPDQEQKYKIQQLKMNYSYKYIRQQFNKELQNLKITKNIRQDENQKISILPVLQAKVLQPKRRMEVSGGRLTEDLYSTIEDTTVVHNLIFM